MDRQSKLYSYNLLKASDHSVDETGNKLVYKTCQQTVDILRERAFHQLNIEKNILPAANYPIETAQKWFTLPGKGGRQHKFPLQTILPKVQMNRNVPPKHLPRDVEVDRRRRQYEKLDIVQLLTEAGITNEEIMPTEEQYQLLDESAFSHFLPISFFDDSNYDCHSPEGWFKLGLIDDEFYPLPARAFLPTIQGGMNHSWQYVSVSDFEDERNLWTVMTLMDECVYHVPKIQFLFFAENPHVFVERLKKAVENRNTAERLIMMEAIVDCVLLQDMRDEHNFHTNPGIEKLLSKCNADPGFIKKLRTEIYLVFEHLMACYEFEKFIFMMPKEFPNFQSDLIRNSLPKAFISPMSIKERKFIEGLQLNMKQIRHDVLQQSLFYIPAGIEAMESVATECQYVESLTIFICNFAKPLPLSDFLQTQQQNSNSVCSYIKNFWPSKIASGILLVLRALGKGWLDVTLDKYIVYNMCKISRFLLNTKLRMEESSLVLLEKSIDNFARFLVDPCKQFYNIDKNYEWPTDDFVNSAFPWDKPIFSVSIGISDNGEVVYSNEPEEFEPLLSDIFKSALEKTAGVRYIHGETMTNLRFARNLYILTVELIEELYLKISAEIHRSYVAAINPMRAYARLYERFIPFCLLSINKFIHDFALLKPSSQMVKNEILEQKRLKEELRQNLPSSITIGPFFVNIDNLKQTMIKKRTEIVKRLFEFYVQRMYETNETLLDACVSVYSKITERPQSIEHLYEIRDFAHQVPERVDQLKSEIQIMWLEYEILDGFFYNLSDQQFAMKWELYAWPHKIMQRLITLRDEQRTDIDDFKRLHLNETVSFQERLETLNEEIQVFSLQFDPHRVMETSVEVKRTWKNISEIQKLGDVLKYRQQLFELEELSLEFLEDIIKGFVPYRNLWGTCSDFVKLEEATVGNPILNIDLDDVRRTVDELRIALEKSLLEFDEKPEIQAVATFFLNKIDEFLPVVECIEWLRNEHWILYHWQELCSRTGMDIKFSAAMNFGYCIRKGIMAHLDVVRELSEKAEADADAMRRAIEEEERLQEEAKLKLLAQKELRRCRRDIL